MSQVALSSGCLAAEAIGGLIKELECELELLNDKIEKMKAQILEVDNESVLPLISSIIKEFVKKVNTLMFEIKKHAAECDRYLRIEHDVVQHISRKFAQMTTIALGKMAAGDSSVETEAELAELNQMINEGEPRCKEIEITNVYLREQLKKFVDKLKVFINICQRANIPVASW